MIGDDENRRPVADARGVDRLEHPADAGVGKGIGRIGLLRLRPVGMVDAVGQQQMQQQQVGLALGDQVAGRPGPTVVEPNPGVAAGQRVGVVGQNPGRDQLLEQPRRGIFQAIGNVGDAIVQAVGIARARPLHPGRGQTGRVGDVEDRLHPDQRGSVLVRIDLHRLARRLRTNTPLANTPCRRGRTPVTIVV